MLSSLDVLRQAYLAQEDWDSALEQIDRMLGVETLLGRPAEDIAITRMNRAAALMEVPDRLLEARAELESCLLVFAEDPLLTARTLGSLAQVMEKLQDFAQAVALQRRTLALFNALSDIPDRARSHGKLAIYLDRIGTPAAREESSRHRLAALLYRLGAHLSSELEASLNNYQYEFQLALQQRIDAVVPRIQALISDAQYHALRQWIRLNKVDVVDLQAAVDELLRNALDAAAGAGGNRVWRPTS